jgi:hypothetical protein
VSAVNKYWTISNAEILITRVLKWLKALPLSNREGILPRLPNQRRETITWTPDVVVHPQYWVESNYTMLERLPPFLHSIIEKAIREQYIHDVGVEITLDAVRFLHETVTIQFRELISTDTGTWRISVENGQLNASVSVIDKNYWPRAVHAWKSALSIIDAQGVQLNGEEEEWDHANLTGNVKIPTDKLKYSIDSVIMWNVLHRNRKNMIVWNKRLWVPNNTQYK